VRSYLDRIDVSDPDHPRPLAKVNIPGYVVDVSLGSTATSSSGATSFRRSRQWGVEWGRRAAIDLEGTTFEVGDRTLSDLAMRKVADAICALLARQGSGRASFDFEAVREGVLVVQLARSALAESAPHTRRSHASGSAGLACHLLAGMVGALLSHVGSRRSSAATRRPILHKKTRQSPGKPRST